MCLFSPPTSPSDTVGAGGASFGRGFGRPAAAGRPKALRRGGEPSARLSDGRTSRVRLWNFEGLKRFDGGKVRAALVAAALAGLPTADAAAASAREIADPFRALAHSATPLNLAEALLEADIVEPVRDYHDVLTRAGKTDAANRVRCLLELYAGNYAGAQQALEILGAADTWAASRAKYLAGLLLLQGGFTEVTSDHFLLRLPTDDAFLSDYALPALENARAKFTELLGAAPTAPVVVEIYPTVESFSFASTLSRDALERSGAAGICKFGRLMILSPQATALGYRWLDSLVHEYAHRHINRLSGGLCPLWLHEGSARYLETLWRRGGTFARPVAEDALLAKASADSALIPFERLEPSFVHLPDPTSVALAYAETSDAVDFLVEEYGPKKWAALLAAFRTRPRDEAFSSALDVGEAELEAAWRESLGKETWSPSRGALLLSARLTPTEDVVLAGPDVQGPLRLGDRLFRQNQAEAAVAQYKKALALEPDNGVALARLARARLAAGLSEEAEPLLRRAMEKNPSYVTPFVMLGDLCFDDGRYEEAQSVLQGALEINPFHPQIHEIFGLIAVDVGDFAAARRSLQMALRFDPDNAAVAAALRRMPKPR